MGMLNLFHAVLRTSTYSLEYVDRVVISWFQI